MISISVNISHFQIEPSSLPQFVLALIKSPMKFLGIKDHVSLLHLLTNMGSYNFLTFTTFWNLYLMWRTEIRL